MAPHESPLTRPGGAPGALSHHLHTPIGQIFIAATARGVAEVGFIDGTGPAALSGPDALTGPAALAILRAAISELREYFDGTRRKFQVPIDLRMEGFRGEVVRALSDIEYGRRLSYKDLAARVGNPGAVRAVGSACANNPVPIFLPCHRVVRTDGTWGNYRGGAEAKTYLLELERAA